MLYKKLQLNNWYNDGCSIRVLKFTMILLWLHLSVAALTPVKHAQV